MLDSAGERHDSPRNGRRYLRAARNALATLNTAAGGDVEVLIALLGSMIEATLNEIEDNEARQDLTLTVLQTLAENMGLRTRREDLCP